jgi:hypothetical protein
MYKALKGFSGLIAMKKNEVREIKDKELINDLLKAGYIEEVKSAKKEEVKTTKIKKKEK